MNRQNVFPPLSFEQVADNLKNFRLFLVQFFFLKLCPQSWFENLSTSRETILQPIRVLLLESWHVQRMALRRAEPAWPTVSTAAYHLCTCSFVQKHDLLGVLFRANDSTFTTMTPQLLQHCDHALCRESAGSGVYNGRHAIMMLRWEGQSFNATWW